ncbi:hypothetical protein PR202_gb07530 [Eleusine coracana subsp. coracana]|uniref:Uncharacterized protein n=1 Tax=Eleusine coracana subsp. coracana TaxID=191504 RepID=A0AAV5ECC8_ELECO|nr:hypothetical protein PR202_gb07530 [Eleusine coracana subsp. coracana]
MAKVKRSATGPAIPSSATTAPKSKKSAPAATEATTSDTTPAAKGTAAAPIVIEIPSSPDYSAGGSRKKARKCSAPPLVLDDEIEMWTPREKRRLDEDCQILSGDPLVSTEMAPAPTAAIGNDDIAVVAERGKVACRDYPHSRFACAKNPFNSTPHERHCDKCFCYVCDIAAPCASWKGTGGHCHASDKDNNWKVMRFVRQKQKK